MALLSQFALLVFFCVVPIYLYAFFRFYRIVKAEQPEWLEVRGSMSFIYDGLPRVSDPNVQVELLRIALGARARQLTSPLAASYADRIRWLGCLGIILFVGGVAGLLASAP